MRNRLWLAGLALAVALTGCDLKAFTPDDQAKAAAAKAYAQFVTGQDDALLKDMKGDIDPAQQRRVIESLRALVPETQGQPGDLVGFNNDVGTNGHTLVLTYRYSYGPEQVLFATTLNRAKDSEPWRVVAANVAPAGKAQAQSPSFGKLPAPPPLKLETPVKP